MLLKAGTYHLRIVVEGINILLYALATIAIEEALFEDTIKVLKSPIPEDLGLKILVGLGGYRGSRCGGVREHARIETGIRLQKEAMGALHVVTHGRHGDVRIALAPHASVASIACIHITCIVRIVDIAAVASLTRTRLWSTSGSTPILGVGQAIKIDIVDLIQIFEIKVIIDKPESRISHNNAPFVLTAYLTV